MTAWMGSRLVRDSLMRPRSRKITITPQASEVLRGGWRYDTARQEPYDPTDPTANPDDGWVVTQPADIVIEGHVQNVSPHNRRLQELGITDEEVIEFFCGDEHKATIDSAEAITIDSVVYEVPKLTDGICEVHRLDPGSGVIRVLTRRWVQVS